MLDKQLTVQYCNKAAESWFGNDAKGKRCQSVINIEDASDTENALATAVKYGNQQAGESVIHAQNKNYFVNYTVFPFLDAKGELVCLLQLIVDVTNIKETQQTIQNVAGEASGISDKVAEDARKLAELIREVSQGAEVERGRVENVVSSVNMMNSTMMEVSRNVGKASDQSMRMRDKAEGGAELVAGVVKSINGVNTVATKLQHDMQELGVQAESIGSVLNVISDIADQTNLLALNAAIEAARAGEAGRGFAVVADEVRKLAEKTMSATGEVGSLINTIQQSAKTTISEVGNAVSNIGAATDLANSSGEALKEIVDLARESNAVITSIASAAEEQSAASDEIDKALKEINEIVQRTTDDMMQSSAAVQELSGTAQQLNAVMLKLL
jgi:methyl-accepting chemotaxis protein